MLEFYNRYKTLKKAYLFLKEAEGCEINFTFWKLFIKVLTHKWIPIIKFDHSVFKYESVLILIIDRNTEEKSGVLLYYLFYIPSNDRSRRIPALFNELKNKLLRENLDSFTIRINEKTPVEFKSFITYEEYKQSDLFTLILSRHYPKLDGDYYTKNLNNG